MDNKPNTRANWIASLKKHPQLTDKHRAFLTQAYDELVGAGEDGESAIAKLLDKYFEKKPKSESKASTYRTALIESFTKDKTKTNYSSVGMIIQKFDKLVESGVDGKTAAKDLLKTYGYESFDSMMTSFGVSLDVRVSTPMSREIESSLQDCPKPKPRKSAIENIRDITKRFNAAIHKNQATLCSAFTAGRVIDIMSPDELTALEQRVPQIESQKDMAYQAFGHVKENLRNLNGLQLEDNY